jgi:methylglutaconyl-CoA hydratase
MKAQFTATREQRKAEARKLALTLRALNEMPKPLIAVVHGAAYGGGVGILSVCDNAIAANVAQFGLTETRLGLIPATIGPYVAKRLGDAAARRVFMSARLFGAEEARQLGLIGTVVSLDELEMALQKEIKAYLATAPGAVAAAKALLRKLTGPIDDAVIEDTITRLADTWEGEEVREGVGAFFEKRKPGWSK